MKLINPTSAQVNAAVAEFVVGFSFPTAPKNGRCDEWRGADYCNSLEAVLPLIEKAGFDATITYSDTCCEWSVTLLQRFTGKDCYRGRDERLSVACCQALLRANGVHIVTEDAP